MISDFQSERRPKRSPKCGRRVFLPVVFLVLIVSGCKSEYPSGAQQNRGNEAKAARQVKTARVEELLLARP